MNINSISTASHRYPQRRYNPGPVYQQPRPYFPPQQRFPQPRPYYPVPFPFYPQPSIPAQVWHGFSERLQEVTQVALHPFNPYARRMPYDYYMPKRPAENFGRWIVNLGLLGGALVAGSAVLGGGFSLGGLGAAVGLT